MVTAIPPLRVAKDPTVALATEEMRSLPYLLYPPLIEEIGLSSAVMEYAKGFAKPSGLQIQVEIAEDLGRLADNREKDCRTEREMGMS